MGTPVIARISHRLSLDGLRAGCVTIDEHGRAHVEHWELGAAGPQLIGRSPLDGDPYSAMAVPLSDGRLLCSWWQPGPPPSQHLLILPDGEPAEVIGTGMRLLAIPSAHGAVLGIGAVAEDGATRETGLYLLSKDLSRVELITSVPDRIGGAVVVGDRVLMSGQRDSRQRLLALDFDEGKVSLLPVSPEHRRMVPMQANGETVLFGVDTARGHRLGVARADEPAAVRLCDGPPGVKGTVLPIAVSAHGDEVLLRVQNGAATSVLRHHLLRGRSRTVPLPPGVTAPVAAFTPHGVWLAHSTPQIPVTMWWQPAGTEQLVPAEPGPGPWLPAVASTFAGAEGTLEAVVYGPDWVNAPHVIVALHGGPSEHWSLAFDHRLQQLAAAGGSVVAVNQRGSTGYGRDHEYAIKGAWGHPDLADILAVARHIHSVRPPGSHPPALYGVSYGAYLALLALAHAPSLWSACVAVAPFLSAQRLYPDSSPGVRALIERLDATTEPPGQEGTRDLLALAESMTGRILLVHGEDDLTIPVSHARMLAQALRERSNATVTYREIPGRGHMPIGPGADLLGDEITDFLTGRL
jgi:pimeloyl-ACP methyl ester carboxylesterase